MLRGQGVCNGPVAAGTGRIHRPKEDEDMPRFPKRESDVIMLAHAMVSGYTTNPGDFPSADAVALGTALDEYATAKADQIEKQAQAQLTTEAKDEKLDGLVEFMKTQLKQSEVDVADDPEKLELIGWGPKAPAQPSNPPGQPRALDPVIQGPGTLFLDWKPPASGTGGTVRTYLVERREQPAGGGEFNAWHQVGIALESEVQMTDQPRGQQLEYRVIGVNAGGQSVPSNTAAVVL